MAAGRSGCRCYCHRVVPGRDGRPTKWPVTFAQVMLVYCFYCNTSQGFPCTSVTGLATRLHADRVKEAQIDAIGRR